MHWKCRILEKVRPKICVKINAIFIQIWIWNYAKIWSFLPNFASIPTIACWSAPLMTSCTLAVVGKHNVWTRILLSPLLEVYNSAAWKATSWESRRSSSMETWNRRVTFVFGINHEVAFQAFVHFKHRSEVNSGSLIVFGDHGKLSRHHQLDWSTSHWWHFECLPLSANTISEPEFVDCKKIAKKGNWLINTHRVWIKIMTSQYLAH